MPNAAREVELSGRSDKSGKSGGREARLAEQLRSNLARRKAQSRSRRDGEADRRPEGIAAAAKSGLKIDKTGQ